MPLVKHILCIHLPSWSITRRYRRRPEYRNAAIAVVRSKAQQRIVVDVSYAARSQGITRGMTAAEARALCQNLHCVDEETDADQRALIALGKWLIRFTPTVSCGWENIDPETDNVPTPSVLFLDLSGSERLFGSMNALVDRIRKSLSHFNIPAQIALAPTLASAWAFVPAMGIKTVMIDSASLPNALVNLSVESLRLSRTILDNLHQLGLHRVGDVLAIPREQLPARFGPSLLKRLDQLTGVLIEPLTKLVSEPPITFRMEFDFSVEALEDIQRIFKKLLGQAIVDLTRKNHGVRQLRLIFKPDRGWNRPTITRTIFLSKPHRDPATLFNLICCETERVDCDRGFVRFQLDVPQHEALAEGQTQLFEQQMVEDEMELDRLLQRLRARLGEAAVIQAERVESYLPERAWRLKSADAPVATVNVLSPSFSPPRPLTLFPTPIEIRVTCEPSDDYIGDPRQFIWQDQVHRIRHVVGPERIAGEWWRGHLHTRDYYDAEDQIGQRFWLFRVVYQISENILRARWFLHGRFD